MELKRGDLVVAVAPGDYGKPRPALVVQSDLLNPTHASILVCLVTSELVDAPLFRIRIDPAPSNGLRAPSQVMIDKLVALRRDRISRRIGALATTEQSQVDRALAFVLGLA